MSCGKRTTLLLYHGLSSVKRRGSIQHVHDVKVFGGRPRHFMFKASVFAWGEIKYNKLYL